MQNRTAVIEGALMPEPEMNVKEEFEKPLFDIIYIHAVGNREINPQEENMTAFTY
jgi:hypothetical protein